MKHKSFQMNNLRLIRENKNLTQLKVSVDLELSQELISQYEIGKSKPTIANLLKLANYFHCSTDFLLERTNIPTPINEINKSSIELTNIVEKINSLPDSKRKELINFLEYLNNHNK